MNIDFIKYSNHGTGYVIKVVYPKKNNLKTETLIYGNRQILPEKKPMMEDSIFDIASLTKTFTAILIHKTIEKDLLKLDDKVKEIDKRFINLDNVTIGDLLAHKINIWTCGYLGDAKTKEIFYQMLFNSKVKEKRAYVDAHYIILSIILESIYGISFNEIVDKQIIKVLNLNNTSFTCLNNNVVSNNYDTFNNEFIDYIYPSVDRDTKSRVAKKLGLTVGHAGIFTTADDLIKLLISLIDDKYILLSKKSINRMLIHDNDTFNIIKTFLKEKNMDDNINNVSKTYDDLINKINDEEKSVLNNLVKLYNYGGMRYKNPIKKINELPIKASDNSVIFSGYTGPIYLIDFKQHIIILIMTNVCHNSKITRKERYNLSLSMINELYNYVLTKIN